ncbi:PilX N-terminal domain-containing pilus assembly protein [Marinobacter bryozoorum]|uniref:pilus assembly PilX family protein n=1 Tax=Marinobacter bryozoorum TaxID=256324 RepID=UPI002004CECE|nr:PilX N-terminal domain-containing pilus assembly protein [Marinobacter bryozoorum]MCK7545425.1 PilX N-terminal domain-containing pilus assembly protein [Marinobacter bryozoorum]
MIKTPRTPAVGGESGSALIVSLVMLLLISLIGISSMQGTVLQERMSSNLQDRNIAFQASESALKVGEDWLAANPLAALTNERLDSPATWAGGGDNILPVIVGDEQLVSQPKYYVGWLGDYCPPSPEGSLPCYDRFAVTSRAEGGTSTSVVILQSTFMPKP